MGDKSAYKRKLEASGRVYETGRAHRAAFTQYVACPTYGNFEKLRDAHATHAAAWAGYNMAAAEVMECYQPGPNAGACRPFPGDDTICPHCRRLAEGFQVR